MIETDSLIEAIYKIFELSQSLNQTVVYLIAGSILLIIGSDYVRPMSRNTRLLYLLLLPAWGVLGASYYYSNSIHRWYVSTTINNNNKFLTDVFAEINEAYSNQSSAFIVGVSILAVWLVSYLLWWVFSRND